MKVKLIILLIFLLCFSSCNKEDSIQKIWISSTWVSSKDSDEYKLIKDRILKGRTKDNESILLHLDSIYTGFYKDKLIYEFKDDSLTITHFNETLYYGFNWHKIKYEFKFDSIYIEEGSNNKELKYGIEKLTKNKLILSYYLKESFHQENVITFQPLKIFNREIKKNDLEELLINNEFDVDIDTISITFIAPQKYTSGKIIPSNSKNILNLEEEGYWYITKIHNELFLVIDSQVMHIKEVQDEKISGLIYGNDNIELSLTKVLKRTE